MTELADIVARGLVNAGQTPISPRVVNSICDEIEAHADEVRAQMEMRVWGMVR